MSAFQSCFIFYIKRERERERENQMHEFFSQHSKPQTKNYSKVLNKEKVIYQEK